MMCTYEVCRNYVCCFKCKPELGFQAALPLGLAATVGGYLLGEQTCCALLCTTYKAKRSTSLCVACLVGGPELGFQAALPLGLAATVGGYLLGECSEQKSCGAVSSYVAHLAAVVPQGCSVISLFCLRLTWGWLQQSAATFWVSKHCTSAAILSYGYSLIMLCLSLTFGLAATVGGYLLGEQTLHSQQPVFQKGCSLIVLFVSPPDLGLAATVGGYQLDEQTLRSAGFPVKYSTFSSDHVTGLFSDSVVVPQPDLELAATVGSYLLGEQTLHSQQPVFQKGCLLIMLVCLSQCFKTVVC
jgi:hypothetical protein